MAYASATHRRHLMIWIAIALLYWGFVLAGGRLLGVSLTLIALLGYRVGVDRIGTLLATRFRTDKRPAAARSLYLTIVALIGLPYFLEGIANLLWLFDYHIASYFVYESRMAAWVGVGIVFPFFLAYYLYKTR